MPRLFTECVPSQLDKLLAEYGVEEVLRSLTVVLTERLRTRTGDLRLQEIALPLATLAEVCRDLD